jgi:hypothetical protein
MTVKMTKPIDPGLLLEASRVMNAAGPQYFKARDLVSDWALKNLPAASADVRAGVLGDAAALRLSGRVAGSYDAVLTLLADIDPAETKDRDGRLHLLRALANGQKYKAVKLTGKLSQLDRDTLLKQVRDDLAAAFKQDPTLREDNRSFWEPFDPTIRSGIGLPERDPTAVEGEDDLREVFHDDAAFRSLVALPTKPVERSQPAEKPDPAPGA